MVSPEGIIERRRKACQRVLDLELKGRGEISYADEVLHDRVNMTATAADGSWAKAGYITLAEQP
jgi:hypothetical protein